MKIKIRKLTTVILLIVGIALVAIGLVAGDAVFVMEKAVNICLECIGIG